MLHIKKGDEDDNDCWKENKLAIIFSSDNMKMIKCHNNDVKYEIKKREYVSYLGSVDIFKKLTFAAALRNGYGKFKKTVLISDGAKWIRNLKEFIFPDAQQIIDFWHVSQHIYNFAKLYFNNIESKYIMWAEKIKGMLRHGEYKTIIEQIIVMEEELSIKINQEKLNTVENMKSSNYLKNSENSIDYLSYRNHGLYISSGHIKSGNKSVAQERLKRPGMRWTTENAQYLLTLRSKFKSALWGRDVIIPISRHYNSI
jgi:hypothetical protein